MANVKISQLTALTPPDAADLVPVTDSSASQTKRTTVGEIVGIINGDVDVADDGTATISELPVSKLQDGDARQLLQTAANGTDVEWTSNVDVPGTLDVTGAATLDSTLGVTGQSTLASAAVSDLTSGRVVLAGTSGELEDNAKLTFNGTQLDVDGNVVITGDLTVEGASTILETETVKVEDKNIELGVVASPTDVTADGGGITLKGTTDKTINWIDATDSWTSSEHVDLANGKSYRINGTEVLSGTTLGSGITGSSLTSLGTIGTGVWQGTAIDGTYVVPSFGSQDIDTTGDLTINSTLFKVDSTASEVRIALASSVGAARMQAVSDSTTSAYLAYASSTTTRNHFRFINGNGEVGSITTAGTATAYNTSSDYRLKENVTPVTDGITRLQQLKPSRFNFIADPDTTVDGFVAHEVQDIVPEAITGEKDAVDETGAPIYQGIDQAKLVPLLTAALQEAIGEIESLKARVAALESLMEKHLATAGAVLAVLTAIVGTTIAVETRYAKSAEVKAQLEDYYAKQLKLRILEIDLKPDPTPSDRALRQYLQQELGKGQGANLLR